MLYKINNIYNSSKLLFSIPVHEEQDIINNQIENILNMNPNSNIILHINKSFLKFDKNLTNYNNVYINPKSFNYKFGKGLLWIHINNFLEAIKLNIDFEYFIILSSNEMFIKQGLISYIEKYKNGLQLEKFNINTSWHNFHKNLDKNQIIITLLDDLNLDTFYGGQTEGQFYEKSVFHKITDIYIKHFGDKELNEFETEEIICQTIFKSFNIEYGLPFTLQNYSNRLVFDIAFINKLVKNKIIIPNNYINTTLFSVHADNDCSSIYSIKRVDRTFNDIRNYLSKKGLILNKDIIQLNTLYFTNYSSIYINTENHIIYTKKKYAYPQDFNWFGFEIEQGYYNINFDIKILNYINNYENIGLKIDFPFSIIYNFFFKDLNIDEWKNVNIPIYISKKQNIIFIFDKYLDHLIINFKNISFDKIIETNTKQNIAISLYDFNIKSNDKYEISYTNINSMIIEPLSDIYNIYIFTSFNSFNNIDNINISTNYYKPYKIDIYDELSIPKNFIKNTKNIINFSDLCNINFKFIIYFSISSIFKQNISNFNFYINKFNFISYSIPYINNEISNSYDFISIPSRYLNTFYNLLNDHNDNINICNSIYYYLKESIGKENFNFIFNDNYSIDSRTPLIKYISDITDINDNNGYLLNKKYMNNIYYKNTYSKILKNNENEFYFYKKKTTRIEDFQWLGLYINDIITDNITVNFNIKLLKHINNIENIGLKIHDPIMYFKEWISECELNIYKNININIKINKVDQYIILFFDNYLGEIEFYIKDFKILLNI